MITDAVGSALLAVIGLILGVLPDAGDLGLSGSDGWLHGYATLDTLVPVHEAVALVVVVLGVEIGIFGVRGILAIYRLIPGKFT